MTNKSYRRISNSGLALAFGIAAIVLLAPISVAIMAMEDSQGAWSHLLATVLPRYASNSLILMLGTSVLAAMIGAGAAWLVTLYNFPFRRVLRWALFLPLAVPGYLGAYAFVDFFEYSGPLQTALRDGFGWETSADYIFPEIRSRGAAIYVLSFALYPYVYLLALNAFREQAGSIYDNARALGIGHWRRFFLLGLPLARPAIAAGMALVMMETLNDLGAVEHFSVQTLTTGIFTTWLEGSNRAAAAQIAVSMIALMIALIYVERHSRKAMRYYQSARQQRRIQAQDLPMGAAILCTIACIIPVALGFVLPVLILGSHVPTGFDQGDFNELLPALKNSFLVGGITAITTVVLAVLMFLGMRQIGSGRFGFLLSVTKIGYAIPGAVLGLGLLIPLAAFDHWFADQRDLIFGGRAGLIITGSAFGLILAYVVRFFALALGSVDTAFGRITPNIPAAARSLGSGPSEVLYRVQLPMIKGSLLAGCLLVFVDTVKELPATLLLRPFGFETLATQVYGYASIEDIGRASPGALVIIIVSIFAVLLVARTAR